MDSRRYVATDAHGVEHAPGGRVEWILPDGSGATAGDPGRPRILRRAVALLEVLDERIFLAESGEAAAADERDAIEVNTARLTAETKWDTAMATRFALDCAAHLLEEDRDVALPDGTSLAAIIADAQSVLDGIAPGADHGLDYLARVRALRRLKHERGDIADLSLMTLAGDAASAVDALDDPAYAALAPITDAVLAAIEALRHHLLPQLYLDVVDAQEERVEHDVLDRKSELPASRLDVTPFGTVELGGPRLRYEPAWASAREAARHARLAVKDRHGTRGETAELVWQGEQLAALLEA